MQVDISPPLQKQIEKLSRRNINDNSIKNKRNESQFIVIGQDHVEPLQAIQNSGQKYANCSWNHSSYFLFCDVIPVAWHWKATCMLSGS
jgi:hypothetical protein